MLVGMGRREPKLANHEFKIIAMLNYEKTATLDPFKRDCLTRFEVGIAIYLGTYLLSESSFQGLLSAIIKF